MPFYEMRLVDSNIKQGPKERTGTVTWNVLDQWNKRHPMELLEAFPIKVGHRYVDGITGHTYGGMYAQSVTAKPDGMRNKRYSWIVTVEYGPKATPEQEQPSVKDSQTISASTEFHEVACFADYDGQWNANSAGQFFEDALIDERPVRVFRWKRKEYFNPEKKAAQYERSINAEPIWGFPPATLFCRSITTTQNISYYDELGSLQTSAWDVDYEIAYNPEGWFIIKADCGYYALNKQSELETIRNEDGSPIETPYLLDGRGRVLSKGATPITRPYRMIRWQLFSGLRLRSPTYDPYDGQPKPLDLM